MEKGSLADSWSQRFIGAAIEVHRAMGSGLPESVCEMCLMHECRLQKIPAGSRIPVDVQYKRIKVEDGFRADLLVDQCLLVE